MVCDVVFGIHVVVCVPACVWPLPGGLLPPQQEKKYRFLGFIPANKQTNKQKTKKYVQ